MEYDSTDLGTGKWTLASIAAGDGATYSLDYQCGNCGEQFTHSEQKGTEAPKKLPCAKCGCCSATKAWQKKEPRMS
jgi:DNA-directed RNA polymerase subunit RPC12/RpoP